MSFEQVKIKLVSNDGITFKVDQKVAFKSNLIKEACENLEYMEDHEITVKIANARTLRKVLEYCRKHDERMFPPKGKREDKRIRLTRFQEMYLNIPHDLLLQIAAAADCLDIPGLLAITTQKLTHIVRGKTEAQLRKIFRLSNIRRSDETKELQKICDCLEMQKLC